MRKFLVTRDVVVSDDTIAPVNFTVHAVNGPTAARFADNGKRDMEAAAGTAPAVSNRERGNGDHLVTLPFAGLGDVLFSGRKAKVSKARRKQITRNSKVSK